MMGWLNGGKKPSTEKPSTDFNPNLNPVYTTNCPQCKTHFIATQGVWYRLPFQLHVKCPNTDCGYEWDNDWLDEETNKQATRKRWGVQTPQEVTAQQLQTLIDQIQVLKSSRDADRQEITLVRQQVDLLISKEIGEIKKSAAEKENDLNGVFERLANLEVWKKELEDGK